MDFAKLAERKTDEESDPKGRRRQGRRYRQIIKILDCLFCVFSPPSVPPICKQIGLLIPRYRGPPSPLGKVIFCSNLVRLKPRNKEIFLLSRRFVQAETRSLRRFAPWFCLLSQRLRPAKLRLRSGWHAVFLLCGFVRTLLCRDRRPYKNWTS